MPVQPIIKAGSEPRLASSGLILGFAVLVFLIAFAYLGLMRQREQIDWVQHTNEVIAHIRAILFQLQDAENRWHSYLRTGEKDDLQRFYAMIDPIESEIRELSRLTADNPDQQRRISRLSSLMKQERAEPRDMPHAEHSDQSATTQADGVDTGMAEMKSIVDAMEQEEYRLLVLRSEEEKRRSRQVHATVLSSSLVALMLLLAAYGLIRRESSARRKAELKLQDTVNTKLEFLSFVTHELRTPLTSIKEGIEIVLDGTAGPLNEEQRDFLQTGKRNVDRLARLINDVLDFQRLEAGRMEFRMQPHDVNLLIREVLQEFSPMARKKGLSLSASLETGLPVVACDRDKVTQVLSNLLSNAIKFTPEGTVTILSQRNGSCIRIVTRDQGSGIKAEDRARLFEHFVQASSEAGGKVRGSGLGLAISKRIIAGHGGEIGIESSDEAGSTFFFTLPIKET